MPHVLRSDFQNAGILGKTKGNKGFIRINKFIGDWDELKQGEFIWLEVEGLPVPYKIVALKNMGDPYIQLSGIANTESAQLLINAAILLPITQKLNQDEGDESGLLNYSIVDIISQKNVGIIKDIQQFPGQIMLFLSKGSGESEELMIPLVEDWVIQVDSNNKKIHMKLPAGLIS
jgi:16S rRNA processing protein RimM